MSIGRILKSLVLLSVLLFFGGFLLSRCGSRTPTVSPPQRTATVVPPQGSQFDVFREASQVRVGQTEPLPNMTNAGPVSLPDGHKVSTDQNGEARLRGEIGGKTCSIFVFFNGSLTKSPCPAATTSGGNTSCQTGSATYRDCDALLIQTPSGQAFQVGTWSWITYLPEREVTVVLTSEGETRVRPVRDADTWDLVDEEMNVPAGAFLFTAPDDRMGDAPPDLPMREVHSWERLPELLDWYPELEPWIRRAVERARVDDVPMPGPEDFDGGDEEPGLPDLVIGLDARGEPGIIRGAPDPAVALPFFAVIANQGAEPAAGFEVALIVESEAGQWVETLWFDEPLRPGDRIEFDGELPLEGEILRSGELLLRAQVDHCETNRPSECQIPEADENNNFSNEVFYPLPPDLFQPPAPPGPDLTAELEVLGTSLQDPDRPGTLFLPVRAWITNQGDQPAGVFKVAIEGTSPNGTFVYPFQVPGQEDQWYPFSDGPLQPGERVGFEGWVLLNAETAPEVITLEAIADSCSGQEFFEPFCRVDEPDEGNNRSEPVEAAVF